MTAVERDLTHCCTACGAFDVPSVVDRLTLPCHHDPVTGKVCSGRSGALMILRRPAAPWED